MNCLFKPTLFAALILWLPFESARAMDIITAIVGITNAPLGNTNTITVTGSTRTWTNDTTVSPGTSIQQTNSIPYSATNLLNHFSAYPVSGQHVYKQTTASNMVIRGGVNQTLTVSQAGNWASITYSTQTVAVPAVSYPVPITSVSATNQTNYASLLVQSLAYSTSVVAESWAALSNFPGLTENNTFTGTNSFSDGGWNRASMTNALLISGILGSLTNGYSSNLVAENLTSTNGANYGNAFRSPGSGVGSEQFGSNSTASGIQSLAVGNGAIATGGRSTALGKSASSTASNGVAIGQAASAAGLNGIAIGRNAEVDGVADSIAIGSGATANMSNSIAMGTGVTVTETNQIMLGLSSQKVRIPGRLEPTGHTTNITLTGLASLGVSGASGPFTRLALRRYNNTTLANGTNAGVNPNNATYMKVSGPSQTFAIAGITNTSQEDGIFLIVQNQSGYDMLILDDSGFEPADVNRIYTMTGNDLVFDDRAVVTLLYDSAASRWIVCNASLTVQASFGELMSVENAGVQTLNASAGTYDVLTNLNTVGQERGIDVDEAANHISVSANGTYQIDFPCSFSGTANATYYVYVHTNGTRATHIGFTRTLGTGGDVGSAAASGFVDLQAGDTIDIRAAASAVSASFSATNANLLVRKVY